MSSVKPIGKSSHTERRVAVLWGPEGTWSVEAIEGVAEFARQHGNWRLLFSPRDQQLRLRLPKGWHGDGVLARIQSRQDRVRCLKMGVPVVDLETIANTPYHYRLGNVVTDDDIRCQMAFSHFVEQRMPFVTCFNLPDSNYSQLRMQVFVKLARSAGYECGLFWNRSEQEWWSLKWEDRQTRVQAWLKRLPKGTGIFAGDGQQGRLLAETCRFLGIVVPDDIAIITGDDDSLLCSISSPPITGVVLAGKQHGYVAAELLQAMMEGAAAPRQPPKIAPLYLQVRQSTDVLKYENPRVVRAMRFIREHACNGIDVGDVVRHVGISRRSLENHFLNDVGHTMGCEIRRVRIERAKQELMNFEKSVRQVADRCGFAGLAQFCSSFRKETGETPTGFRGRVRGK